MQVQQQRHWNQKKSVFDVQKMNRQQFEFLMTATKLQYEIRKRSFNQQNYCNKPYIEDAANMSPAQNALSPSQLQEKAVRHSKSQIKQCVKPQISKLAASDVKCLNEKSKNNFLEFPQNEDNNSKDSQQIFGKEQKMGIFEFKQQDDIDLMFCKYRSKPRSNLKQTVLLKILRMS